MAPSVKTALRSLRVDRTGEEHSAWGNRDIFPVPVEQQRFTIISYFSFWAVVSMSITAWSYGGSFLALGLSAAEGIGCITVAFSFVSIFAYLCGHPGAYLHLGFTGLARASFGLYGSYLPVLLLVFENVIFFGINGYFGGLSAVVFISAMSPGFKNMKNTLPESAGITTQALVGFVVFLVVFFALLPIHSSKFRRIVWPAACCAGVVFISLFAWAISANHGSPGNLITPKLHLSGSNKSFAMLYAISSAAGSSTAYASRMSDWTRFSKTKNAPTVPLLLGAPIFGLLTAIFGILATNAVHAKDGVIEWNPLVLLIYLQEKHYNPACRAATFFAGVALFISLIMNNLMGKVVPAGMDCAGLFPKYITTRRGSVILCIIGVIIQPWRFVTESSTFLSVLSSFGVFVSPLTGILAADYWLIRRRKWKIPDLFEKDGIYWYTFGINWRAMAAFFISIVFSMPGFICSVDHTTIAIGWTRVFQMSYIVNLCIAVVVFCVLSWVFPPVGTGIAQGWHAESVDVTTANASAPPEILDDKEAHTEEVEYLPPQKMV